jgi:hypothetical protein
LHLGPRRYPGRELLTGCTNKWSLFRSVALDKHRPLSSMSAASNKPDDPHRAPRCAPMHIHTPRTAHGVLSGYCRLRLSAAWLSGCARRSASGKFGVVRLRRSALLRRRSSAAHAHAHVRCELRVESRSCPGPWFMVLVLAVLLAAAATAHWPGPGISEISTTPMRYVICDIYLLFYIALHADRASFGRTTPPRSHWH